MKNNLTALVLLIVSSASGQRPVRADRLPFAEGEIHHSGYFDKVTGSDDGSLLYMRGGIVDIKNKNVFIPPGYSPPGQEYVWGVKKTSANQQYAVTTYVEPWNYSKKKGNSKPPKAKWLTATYKIELGKNSLERYLPEGWGYDFYDDHYTLAVTNDGKLIATGDPGKVKKGYQGNPNISQIKGIYLFDPRTQTQHVITNDLIKQHDDWELEYFLNANETMISIFVVMKLSTGLALEVTNYDIKTGAKSGFQMKGSFLKGMIGNEILLGTKSANGNEQFRKSTQVIRLKDGTVLFETTAANHEELMRYTISGDTVHYFNPEKFDIASFVVRGNEMQMERMLRLDTAGLGIPPVPHNLAKVGNRFALIPHKEPENHWTKKQYSAYLFLFSDQTGTPEFAVKPFFKDPEKAMRERIAKEQEFVRKCQALKADAPFKMGAVLRSKSSAGETYLFDGVDCQSGQYLLAVIGKGFHMHLFPHEMSKYEDLNKPGQQLCSQCNGTGKITRAVTSKDDKWEQVNFNIYVRNPNATKTEHFTSTCKVCKGLGYFK